jgi:phage protein D
MPNLSDNIPETHITLPKLTVVASPLSPKTKDPDKQARTKEAAISRLKQKNRKHHTMEMTTLFDLSIEAGNNYKFTGFSPDIDDGIWTVAEVTHSMTGKSASNTRIQFHRPPEVE